MQSGAQLHHAPSRDRDTGRSEGELGAGGAGGRAAGGRGAWGWAARLGLGRGGAAYVRAEQCTMVQCGAVQRGAVQCSVVQCRAAWCSAVQDQPFGGQQTVARSAAHNGGATSRNQWQGRSRGGAEGSLRKRSCSDGGSWAGVGEELTVRTEGSSYVRSTWSHRESRQRSRTKAPL